MVSHSLAYIQGWPFLVSEVSSCLLPQQVHEASSSNELLFLCVTKLPSCIRHMALLPSFIDLLCPIPSLTFKPLWVDFTDEICADVPSNKPWMLNNVTQYRDIMINA